MTGADRPGRFDQLVSFLRVGDLDRAASFYTDVLGLELVLDQGACRIFRASADAFIGVCAHRGPPHDPTAVITTFVTQDVEGWHARLVAAGAVVDAEPTFSERFGVTHFFFRDPDGYLLEVQRFHDPAWPRPAGGGDRR
ncbi:MAG: VOC family protein [Azospirillaceae bacterium]